jgi:twinkle protein
MANFLPDDIDFAAYMRDTDAKAKVKSANTWIGELKDRLRTKSSEKRICLPWDKTHADFDFKPGEVTVWGGINGHGKSLVTTQIALSLLGQDQKVCIASFELKPRKTLERMTRMYCGTNPYSPEYQGHDGLAAIDNLYDEFGEWTNNRLWLYDQQGTTDTDMVIGMAKYCANELKIDHIFIDNLAKCVKNEDDYNAQKNFIEEMCSMARDLDCHIHVVHHMRKGNKETDMIDKNDFKGSGSIADQPDNLIGVWRNKGKEIDLKTNGGASKRKDEPDTILCVFKQRNHEGAGDDEPRISLYFNRDSGQFTGIPGELPLFFPNFPHRRSM